MSDPVSPISIAVSVAAWKDFVEFASEVDTPRMVAEYRSTILKTVRQLWEMGEIAMEWREYQSEPPLPAYHPDPEREKVAAAERLKADQALRDWLESTLAHASAAPLKRPLVDELLIRI